MNRVSRRVRAMVTAIAVTTVAAPPLPTPLLAQASKPAAKPDPPLGKLQAEAPPQVQARGRVVWPAPSPE